jgi:hypothetical protein
VSEGRGAAQQASNLNWNERGKAQSLGHFAEGFRKFWLPDKGFEVLKRV